MAVMDPAKIRADAVNVIEEVTKALSPGADGVEAGLTTTEFWLSVVVLVADVVLPAIHVAPLSGQEQGIVASFAVAGYALARGIRKRGATATVPSTWTRTESIDPVRLNPPDADKPATPPSVAAMSAPPSPPA